MYISPSSPTPQDELNIRGVWRQGGGVIEDCIHSSRVLWFSRSLMSFLRTASSTYTHTHRHTQAHTHTHKHTHTESAITFHAVVLKGLWLIQMSDESPALSALRGIVFHPLQRLGDATQEGFQRGVPVSFSDDRWNMVAILGKPQVQKYFNTMSHSCALNNEYGQAASFPPQSPALG